MFSLQEDVQQLHQALGKLYDTKRTKEMLEGTLVEELKPKLVQAQKEVEDHMNRITEANER